MNTNTSPCTKEYGMMTTTTALRYSTSNLLFKHLNNRLSKHLFEFLNISIQYINLPTDNVLEFPPVIIEACDLHLPGEIKMGAIEQISLYKSSERVFCILTQCHTQSQHTTIPCKFRGHNTYRVLNGP